MQSLSEIKALLEERGIRPRHRFGQNFLHDKNQLLKLLDAANVQTGELVLEVGPGTGTLTEGLLERGAEVIAVEIDRDLATIVRERLGDRIVLIEEDCLEKGRRLNRSVLEAIGERSFKLVANLPYGIASPLIASLLIDHGHLRPAHCAGQFVTIQREVADRLLAQAGTKAYGPLTVIVRALGRVRRIATLKPSNFWPQPKVTSAMVSILPFAPHERRIEQAPAFARFVTQLFSKRRKQLGTIFGGGGVQTLPEGLSPQLRPDALSVEQIIALYRAMQPSGKAEFCDENTGSS